MVKMAQELNFAEGAQAEHAMVEGRNALDCDLALGRYVYGGTIGDGHETGVDDELLMDDGR